MDKIIAVLTNYGLSDNEIKVYVEALKHSEISPFKLARLTKIPRTTVYDVMMTLSLKGLIELKQSQGLEKQQTWIRAKNPSVLREAVFERRKDLARLEVDIVDILPDLKGDYLKTTKNSSFRFYPGIDGVKKTMDKLNTLPTDITVYVWDHLMPMDTLGRRLVNKDVDEGLDFRRKVKLKTKTIIPLTDWTKHVLSYQYGRDPEYLKYHNFRYIDFPGFNIHQDIYLFSNKVIIVTAKEDEAWSLEMESRLLAKSLRSMFEFMWQLATPADERFVKSLGENEFLKQEKAG